MFFLSEIDGILAQQQSHLLIFPINLPAKPYISSLAVQNYKPVEKYI